ncbi:hypothetical protein B0A50_00479 [Salinomyces thailandicus]|uniref:Uncharacterized protein n=1 Tax=Salinomyces thailandicus TaxID=706561 RepID=A0A4U0UDS9_9PEZI|nr:hypothetical protein B0A50_00479 [Salinomyces thailandica]
MVSPIARINNNTKPSPAGPICKHVASTLGSSEDLEQLSASAAASKHASPKVVLEEINVRELDRFCGSVRYVGGGWYRPEGVGRVTRVLRGESSALPGTRAEFLARVRAYGGKHPNVVAGYYPVVERQGDDEDSEEDEDEDEDVVVRPLRKRRRSEAVSEEPPEGVVTRAAAAAGAMAKRASRRLVSGLRERFPLTRLSERPGVEFRGVGHGWYKRSESRVGEWMVVPRSPESVLGQSRQKQVEGKEKGRLRERVHFTRLSEYPGGEFTAVGDGWYERSEPRVGAWVVVPWTPKEHQGKLEANKPNGTASRGEEGT